MSETIKPATSPGVGQRAAGPHAEIHVGPPLMCKDGVFLTVLGHDGAMVVAPLTKKEARQLAAMLRRQATVSSRVDGEKP